MRRSAFERMLKPAIGASAAFVVLWPFDAALAACTPAAANDITATCTGTTINQGAGAPGTSASIFGYGTGAESNINITIVQGATVTGQNQGIRIFSGSVINYGTINGGINSAIFANGAVNVLNFGIMNQEVSVGDGSNVVNPGTINGPVAVGASSAINNSGTINGGVNAQDSSTIINSGNINGDVNGDGSLNFINSGIVAGAFQSLGAANLINSGTIAASNVAVNVMSSLNLVNSGLITGGDVAIKNFGGASNVINSGTISAPTAIQFTGGADTLTLLPGSKIIGAINLGGGGDTVNFRTGNQNLTFDTLVGATITGNVPFAVSGNQVATIDPTPFAANGRVLGDFSRSVSQVVPEFGNQPAATGGAPMGYAPPSPSSVVSSAFDGMPGLQAYAADQAVFKAPTVVQADGTAIWARGFGGYRTQDADGVLLRTSNTFYGGAIGIEKQVRYDLRIGAFAGGGTTRSTIELNTGDTNSNLGFGGLYARYFRGASFLYAAVQGGGSQNDTSRNINNNLAAGGLETAKGSYSGWYISPELRLGHNIALGRVMDSQYTLTPSIGVRYLYGSFGGYTETGSTANLTVNSQTVGTLEERAELKLTRATQFNATTALLIDVTGGALATQRVGSNTVNAALLGQSIPFAVPGKDDTWGGFGGGGMEWRTGNVSLFASGEYLWLSDSSTVVSGKGGVRVAF